MKNHEFAIPAIAHSSTKSQHSVDSLLWWIRAMCNNIVGDVTSLENCRWQSCVSTMLCRLVMRPLEGWQWNENETREGNLLLYLRHNERSYSCVGIPVFVHVKAHVQHTPVSITATLNKNNNLNVFNISIVILAWADWYGFVIVRDLKRLSC